MPDDEGMALYRAGVSGASVGPLLEIGSYCGKSAVYLGAAGGAGRIVGDPCGVPRPRRRWASTVRDLHAGAGVGPVRRGRRGLLRVAAGAAPAGITAVGERLYRSLWPSSDSTTLSSM